MPLNSTVAKGDFLLETFVDIRLIFISFALIFLFGSKFDQTRKELNSLQESYGNSVTLCNFHAYLQIQLLLFSKIDNIRFEGLKII